MKHTIFILSFVILFFGHTIYRVKFSAQKKYNVIIIALDLLKAKNLHFFEYERDTTPDLDMFLSSSYVFTNAFSPSSWTRPSFSSFLTSLYPHETKMTQRFNVKDKKTKKKQQPSLKNLGSNVKTLPQILKSFGYKTAAFTDGAAYDQRYGYSQGFDIYYNSIRRSNTANTFGLQDTVPKVIEWIEKNNKKPFFLFLQTFDIHNEGLDHLNPEYKYVKDKTGISYTGTNKEFEDLRKSIKKNEKILNSKEIEFWKSLYDEQIYAANRKIAPLLNKLNESEILNNSIIIFTSNHGQEIYEHDQLGHGHTLYNELVHVPLAIRLPSQNAGKKIKSLISTIDILPTILDILSIPLPSVPQQMRGINLVPAFSGKDLSHTIYAETDLFLEEKLSILAPDGWKLIATMDSNHNPNIKELYNLINDPLEKNNLSKIEKKKMYELEKDLYAFMEKISYTNSY